MKQTIILLGFLLGACSQAAGDAVVLPEFISTPTPYIDPSYPTALAEIESENQYVNGIDVRIIRAWVEGKNLNAEVCFTMPDSSDWSIYSASLKYTEVILDVYGTTFMSVQEPANGQAGLRCDTLTFIVPPDADLSSATINIDAIAATPREGEYCSMYMPKIQQTMLERGIGIVLECADVNGVQSMRIANIPPEMTQEQAEQIVYSEEFFAVKGPWSFSINLEQ